MTAEAPSITTHTRPRFLTAVAVLVGVVAAGILATSIWSAAAWSESLLSGAPSSDTSGIAGELALLFIPWFVGIALITLTAVRWSVAVLRGAPQMRFLPRLPIETYAYGIVVALLSLLFVSPWGLLLAVANGLDSGFEAGEAVWGAYDALVDKLLIGLGLLGVLIGPLMLIAAIPGSTRRYLAPKQK